MFVHILKMKINVQFLTTILWFRNHNYCNSVTTFTAVPSANLRPIYAQSAAIVGSSDHETEYNPDFN